MQTFLPYPDFNRSASVLDMKRLGKQRVECLQLIRGSWPNHPASKMWRGHEYALGEYGLAICNEWKDRGYNDTCYDKISIEMAKFLDTGNPKWIGDEDFHLAHKSNLLRKDFDFYSKFWPDIAADLPYIWPI